ncbi:DUF4214 domain-containing protein [Campylobacter sp. RM16189]|uniref:DUF4214 domain-containing protein n=1 Tax=Campylobacter sp. RM16189 TaxID=1705726 RepID=UPI001474F913|nr:DUF4214 domain-containing protein [Campylobacter sp. RM16189]
MALTKTQVSQLYVTLFGRASESSGSKFWQKTQPNMTEAATNMLNDESAKAFFGSSIDTNAKFVNHIYENVFGRAAEAEGFNFWVSALEKGNARGFIVSEMIKAAEKNEPTFNAKVAVSDYLADKDEAVMGTHRSVYVEALDKAAKEGVDVAKAYVDSVALDAWISTPTNPGKVETLTALQEEKVANVFEAPMVYNPGGTDYIPSLQDEDKLIGIVGRSDNTLNATLGQENADEGTGTARTPNLVNIQYLNAKLTGNVNHLDLRYADSLTKVNLHHFTNNADGGADTMFTVDNISSKLEGMRVANLDDSNDSAMFEFKQGILNATDDKGLLELADVNANSIIITSRGNDSEREGYETLDLVAKSGVDINTLSVADLRVLNISGDGNLEIAMLTSDKEKEYNALSSKYGGVEANNTNYFEKLDASKLNGKMTVDISRIAKDWVDTADSATKKDTTIIGTAKDDTFYTSKAIGGRLTLDGGEGKDKFVVVSGDIGKNADKKIAKVTNIESLELRTQGTDAIKVDFDAFDNTLDQVIVRDENNTYVPEHIDGKGLVVPEVLGNASTFTFNNVTKDFADNKKFIIEHSVTEPKINQAYNVLLEINLKDPTAKDDKLNIEVVNAPNRTTEFNYKIKTAGVETINLVDSDSEDNTVILETNEKLLEISGGKSGNTYTIDNVVSPTVNAAGYLGDLRIQAVGKGVGKGDADQSITLGEGNDVVTFTGEGYLTSKDKVVGGAGDDVLRAVLSADTTLNVTGVETLHLASTSSIELDIAGGDFGKLVFISGQSTAHNDKILGNKVAQHLSDASTKIDTSDLVTIAESNISELNFSGDLYKSDTDFKAANEDRDHTFNGVWLKKNASETLDVNINAALDDVKMISANNYNVGQIYVNGTKTFNLNVSNDRAEKAVTPVSAAVTATETTIDGITGKDLSTITLSTKGNLTTGIVTGDGINSVLTKFDASGVVGNLNSTVNSLGDNAQVILADGNNTFDALGSGGKLIHITAGNGNNTITGSSQSDYITAGDGNNVINADLGDNIIKLGEGGDIVITRDGSDSVDLGGGFDKFTDNKNGGGAPVPNATTTVTKTSGAAQITIFPNGNDETAGLALSTANQLLPSKITAVNTAVATAIANAAGSDFQTAAGGPFVTAIKAGWADDTHAAAAALDLIKQKVADYTLTNLENALTSSDARFAGISDTEVQAILAAAKKTIVDEINKITTAALVAADTDGDNLVDGGELDTLLTAAITAAQAAVGGVVTPMVDNSFVKDIDEALGAANHIDQWIAVGEGSTLKFQWKGLNDISNATVLDGRVAKEIGDIDTLGAGQTPTDNNDFWLIKGVTPTANSLTINGGKGNDVAIVTNDGAALTFTGGAGNDAAVGGMESDFFQGGQGADVFVMNNRTLVLDGKQDTVKIADGESTAKAYDVIYAFDASAGASDTLTEGNKVGVAGKDSLDLALAFNAAEVTIASAAGKQDVVGHGDIVSLTVDAHGLVTFEKTENKAAVAYNVVDEAHLANVLALLADKFNGKGITLAFAYDKDGDLTTTQDQSTFVFQDGTTDTVVELAGLTGVQGLEAVGGGGAANYIAIG